MNSHCCCPSTKTHGPYAEIVYLLQQFPFQSTQFFIRIGGSYPPKKRLFCKDCPLLKIPAYANTQNNRRARISSRFFDDIYYKIFYSRQSLGRLQHHKPAHILASRALGRYRYLKPVTFNNIHVKNRRRVITCIFPCKGMTDRLPKIAVFVTLPYTLIYCIFQRTIYYGIAAYFNKKYRYACILAHGRIFF